MQLCHIKTHVNVACMCECLFSEAYMQAISMTYLYSKSNAFNLLAYKIFLVIILSSIFCNTYQDWWQAFTLNDWCVIHRWNRCTYTYVCSYLKLPSLIYIHLDLDLNYYHAFKETDHLFLFCCSHPEIVVAIPCRFYLTC